MIAIVLAQLAARWGQAATLAVLSLAVTLGTVSAPAFARAIDQAAVEKEVAAAHQGEGATHFALGTELVVSFPPLPSGGSAAGQSPLTAYDAARGELTGFLPVTTVGINVRGLTEHAPPSVTRRLLARDGFCRYVTFREGRCPVGSREAALPSALAAETERGPGDEVALTPVRRGEQDEWVPDGPPTTITLVGVFEANDPRDPYWVPQDPLSVGILSPAILSNRTLMRTLPHEQETSYLDAIVPPELLAPDRLPAVRRQVEAAEERLAESNLPGAAITTNLPQLLDRIESHGDQARALLPIAMVSVVVLGWFVVFLAVSQPMSGRRHEVGMVALRGTQWRTRVVAVAAESLLPIVVGIPAGLVAAQLLVAAVGPGTTGPVGVDRDQLLAAGIAAAGTLAVALLALQRELAAPVVRLLRQVQPRRRRAAVAVGPVLVVTLALAMVADLRAFDGAVAGIMVAAPVVVLLAGAVLVALALRPLTDLAGRWSLRRGRLGSAVAALYVARQPGTFRLVVVLAVALGTFGFAAVATDVAAQGRGAETQRLLGAARVLDVEEMNRIALLEAVRAVDPTGEYAMAVVAAPGAGSDPPVLAVDATRLAQVAQWSDRYGARSPAEVADLLRPPAAEPVLLRDGELIAELIPDPFTADDTVTVSLALTASEGNRITVKFGPVTEDQLTYRTEVTSCADGCRLAGVSIATTPDSTAGRMGVTVRSLRQDGAEVMPLDDHTRWRPPEEGAAIQHLSATATQDGLLLGHRNLSRGAGAELFALDVPYPLPVVTAGGGGPREEVVAGVDGELIRFEPQADLAGLPGVGAVGMMLDLEYAERLAVEPGPAMSPQVWLAADALAGIVAELTEHGLVITGDRTIEDLRTSIDESGAAQALRFYQLAAGIAVLIGLGALILVVAVDRHTWLTGLQMLRAQGLANRTAILTSLWTYGGIVVAAAVAGALAALATWFAVGEQLPLGVDSSLLTAWPSAEAVLAPWLLAVAMLIATAGLAAGWQRRTIGGG